MYHLRQLFARAKAIRKHTQTYVYTYICRSKEEAEKMKISTAELTHTYSPLHKCIYICSTYQYKQATNALYRLSRPTTHQKEDKSALKRTTKRTGILTATTTD